MVSVICVDLPSRVGRPESDSYDCGMFILNSKFVTESTKMNCNWTSSIDLNAAGNAQKRDRCCYRSNLGAHHLHIDCGGGWQHAGVQDISGHGCDHWRPPLPRVLSFVVFLPTIVVAPYHVFVILLVPPASPHPTHPTLCGLLTVPSILIWSSDPCPAAHDLLLYQCTRVCVGIRSMPGSWLPIVKLYKYSWIQKETEDEVFWIPDWRGNRYVSSAAIC